MNSRGFFSILLTTLIVIAFGWGAGYVSLTGWEMVKSRKAFPKVTASSAPKNSGTVSSSQNSNPFTAPSNKLVLMIGGDLMFDRNIRARGELHGYESLFDSSVTDLFKTADYVMVNLEGPITSQPSKTLIDGKTTKVLTFTFATSTAETLAYIGVDMVSLANNHTDNFLTAGFLETQRWLEEAGIEWFGNPWNSTTASLRRKIATGAEPRSDSLTQHNSPITTFVEKNGITLAFVGYHAFQTGIDRVITEIKRIENPDIFTIVMPHWGEEYEKEPSERQKSQAQAFIDAGADAIIGAHPHVVMSNEWIDKVPVYYSIGNFLFDQFFSEEVMKGQIVELQISKDSNGTILDYLVVHETRIDSVQGVKLSK